MSFSKVVPSLLHCWWSMFFFYARPFILILVPLLFARSHVCAKAEIVSMPKIFCFPSVLLRFFFFSVISKEKWEYMLASNNLNSVDMRDNRYNQIIHLVSAANGAEDFYSTEVCPINQIYSLQCREFFTFSFLLLWEFCTVCFFF